MRRAAVLGSTVVVLTGCGGGAGKTTNAATIVPAGATSYVQARTSELPRAVGLLARFPRRGGLLRRVPRVPPGAGPELDVATLAGGGRVFYTQPADEHAFAKRLDASGRVHARISGWTVFATSPALLDAVKHRRGSLGNSRWFVAAGAALPSHAALREVVPGWRATALSVHLSDAELEVHRLRRPLPQSSSALAAEVPADAIAAAGVAGPQSFSTGAPKLLVRLASVVHGPAVGWVRPDAELPEVTVVARPADGPRALRATETLLALLTKNPVRTAVTVEGVQLTEVANGAIDFYVGLVRGRLVLSDSAAAAVRTGSRGKALPAVARLPGATESWAFADVSAALPLAHLFAGLFATTVPPALEASVAPLRDVLVYASHEGRVATVVTRIGLG
jgi:hypothetical protein